jgi:hypothetical protein
MMERNITFIEKYTPLRHDSNYPTKISTTQIKILQNI